MNAIAELLAEVHRTGQLPTDEEVSAAVTRGRTVAARHAARATITRTCKKIVNALDSDLPDQAEQLAEAVADELAEFTEGGAGTSSRELIADVPRTRTAAHHPATRPDTAAVKQMAELFGSRLRDRVTAADLDKLATRAGATKEDVAAWRSEVLAADREVRHVYANGQQGLARRLIKEHAAGLADMIAEPEPRDPHEDVDDPRSLGALVPRGLAS